MIQLTKKNTNNNKEGVVDMNKGKIRNVCINNWSINIFTDSCDRS